jgi:5-methylcytosine-specific restriction endonuclease McrA
VIRRSKKKASKRRIIAQLDELARQRVFERDNFTCVRCGKKDGIQWSHIISRAIHCTRWEDDNALTMCGGCHMFFWHKHPLLAVPWFMHQWPERYENIRRIYNAGGKVDVRELLANSR